MARSDAGALAWSRHPARHARRRTAMTFSDVERAFIERHRLAHLATADPTAVPHVVPICFAVVGDRSISSSTTSRSDTSRIEASAQHRGQPAGGAGDRRLRRRLVTARLPAGARHGAIVDHRRSTPAPSPNCVAATRNTGRCLSRQPRTPLCVSRSSIDISGRRPHTAAAEGSTPPTRRGCQGSSSRRTGVPPARATRHPMRGRPEPLPDGRRRQPQSTERGGCRTTQAVVRLVQHRQQAP